MRIGLVLVTYSLLPARLFASIPAAGFDLRWHILHHGPDPKLARAIRREAGRRDAAFSDFGENRGLSRSWNDGLVAAARDGCTVTLILNDDLFFYPDGFARFIAFVEEQIRTRPDVGAVMVMGQETGPGMYSGQINNQGLACAALTPRCLAEVGAFDENFRVAYCEDLDYMLRIAGAGLSIVVDERVLVEHERGTTKRSDPDLDAFVSREGDLNHDYYARKWGGRIGQGSVRHPFDDPRTGFFIPFSARAQPYGPGRDRDDPPPGRTEPPPGRTGPLAPARWRRWLGQPSR